jgi:hypothetical protein
MNAVPERPLPLLRLALYLLIVGVCGAVACRELYYALACESTTAAVVAIGKTGGKGSRTSGFWAQYEYLDDQGERHLGRAESFNFALDGTISPTVGPGDILDIQFLRHAPQTSRVTPSPIGGICFAAVAFLAGFVFAAELVVPWQRRRRRRRLTWLAAVGLAAILGTPAGGQEEPRPKDFTSSIGMKFVWIPPGTFAMGSPNQETGRGDDEIPHKVTMRGFYMGVHAVTQEQWQTVMGNNPSEFKGDKNLPVELYGWSTEQNVRQAEVPIDEHNHAIAALRYLLSILDARRMAGHANPAAGDAPPRPAQRRFKTRKEMWNDPDCWTRFS